MRNKLIIALTALMAATLTACGDKRIGGKPGSGGAPYEVVVAGDADSVVCRLLSRPAEGLPQTEPMFDVTACDSLEGRSTLRLMRNIVMVNIDPRTYTDVGLKYERDVYARPQIVIYVNSPSRKALADNAGRLSAIVRLLNSSEAARYMAEIKPDADKKASAAVKAVCGHGMYVPAEMRSMKKGRNFVWISDNGAERMQNICVFTIPRDNPTRWVEMCDSTMKANIPGERDDMSFRLCDDGMTIAALSGRDGKKAMMRGLWQMEGDAMGGPFAALMADDSTHARTIVAAAFAYAPGKKKRNMMRRLEAALRTLE